jgi:hypothetical protein
MLLFRTSRANDRPNLGEKCSCIQPLRADAKALTSAARLGAEHQLRVVLQTSDRLKSCRGVLLLERPRIRNGPISVTAHTD